MMSNTSIKLQYGTKRSVTASLIADSCLSQLKGKVTACYCTVPTLHKVSGSCTSETITAHAIISTESTVGCEKNI